MPKWMFIASVVLVITNIDQCFGGSFMIKGIFSPEDDYSGRTFLERTLFTRNSTTPKSYVIGFKYVANVFSTVIYHGRMHSDAENTWGHGDLSNGIDIHDNHYLNAQMHIQNATNFEVGISINGMSGIGDVGMSRFLRLNIFRPRSSALICAVSEQKPQTRYQHLVFGERKHGDFIVHASKNSFNGTESHLPRHQIEFQDNNVVLTSVSIRLNSTRAIVFHNKVELSEHRFFGTIYGLVRDTIGAVVIIYGYKT